MLSWRIVLRLVKAFALCLLSGCSCLILRLLFGISEAEYYVSKMEWPVDVEAQKAIKSTLFDYDHSKLLGATLNTESNRAELIVLMTEQDHHLIGHLASEAKPTKKLAPMIKVRGSAIAAPFPLLACLNHLRGGAPKNFIDNQVTFAIFKPDLVKRGFAKEAINTITSKTKLNVLLMSEFTFSERTAEEFYREHRGKPFFGELIEYMSEGPSIALMLYGPDAVRAWREFMGPTNPAVARETAPGSLRAVYGLDLTHNSFHGSDSLGSASREIQFACKQLIQ